MISDPHELYGFLPTPGVEIVNLLSERVWASWRYTAEDQVPNLRHTNEVIGAFVACGGLMHLYSYLDRL